MESLKGQLLVASPTLLDPNFFRTVVAIFDHDEEGALGVVLNRPSDTEVSEAVPDLVDLVEPADVVRLGGPVQPQAVSVIAEVEDTGLGAAVVLGDVALVAAEAEVDALASSSRRARVFAGYAGWGPGQLDAELEREDWILEPMRREDVFSEDAEDLWSLVLERKGGAYALVSRMPTDPSLN